MIQYTIDCIMFNSMLIETGDEHKLRLEKQEKWRQRQINIFYRTGKPIFSMSLDTQHVRSNNNPQYFIEKKRWET